MPTISSRFARSVRPPLSRWSHASTNGVTAWPWTPCRVRFGERLARSAARRRRGSRPAAAPTQEAAALELPVRGARSRAISPARLDARRDRRAAARRRRRAAARRCGSRAPARRASRAARRSPARRAATSRRRRRRRPASAASAAEVGRDVGRRRPAAVDAAEAAGRHHADAESRCRSRACRRPSSRPSRAGRPRRPGRAARPCAPSRRTAPSSASVSPTTISPSRTPIVAGTAPPSRTAASEARPTSTPSPGGKPCATSVVSRATTPRPSASAARDLARRRGSRHRPELRAAAGRGLRARRCAADEEARGECVACAGRDRRRRPAAPG